MRDEAPFLQMLQSDPRDDVTRAVYADWLEEKGKTYYSEFLRLQLTIRVLPPDSPERRVAQERLGVLHTRLDTAWLQMVDPLARLGPLSKRAQIWAPRLGVKTVGDLCQRSAGDILERCFGVTVLHELQRNLAEHGLRLRDD